MTTILALLPVLFSSGLGAELQRPLAFAVIGGLFMSTIASLYFVPAPVDDASSLITCFLTLLKQHQNQNSFIFIFIKKTTMQKAVQTYSLVLASFLTVIFFASYYSETQPEQQKTAINAASKNLPQIIRPVNLDRPFDFAGEPLPMGNFDVRERLDRELLINTYLHATTLLHIKNTYKYFPVIEKILAANNMPDDFKYLAVAESSLRNAVSSAGAKGIWQFVQNTGEYYGLEINDEVDERYHIEKATEAACKYLKDYQKQFGNWTLSAAAYNMGGPRLKREMETQRANNYYDLNLNDETSRYVFRLVAIKEILKNPDAFGFYLNDEDGYPPMSDYKIAEVNGPIASLGDFAMEHGTTYRMLKVYNPWLISSRLTNRAHKTYQIKIPK